VTETRAAPAKVNLYLHVGAPGPDGYHPLSSLVAFGAAADTIEARPAETFAFSVEGPFAVGLETGEDNLVVRAVRAAARAAGAPMPALHLVLHKRLPVAAGLGGGSGDAAAALRLVRDSFLSDLDDAALVNILAELGADGPMCLAARPVIAEGRGDRLSSPPAFPDLPVVLVNPRVACPTGEVYRAYDATAQFGGEVRGALRQAYGSAADLAADLAGCRNDLEPAARALQPLIGEVLDELGARPDVLLARMSGSGATCFALCSTDAEASRIRDSIRSAHPDWWVVAGVLEGGCA